MATIIVYAYIFCVLEMSGCDFSCVVSSLVQIYLDPYFRTRAGFQLLIQKEWVKMGHPFQKYLVLVFQADAEQVKLQTAVTYT